jgi:predicted double-glycine peptidase
MPGTGCAGELTRELRQSFLLFSLAAVVLMQGCSALPTSTNEASFQRRYGDFTYCSVEVVKQSRNYTCGPACLSSVLAYWDIDISQEQIVQKYPTGEHRPYLLLELRSIAEADGLKAYVISMDTQSRSTVEEHIAKGRPLICAVRLPRGLHFFDGVPILSDTWRTLAWALHPRKDHFVVVAGSEPQKVLVMDPAHGFAALSWHRFEGAWSQMKHACLLVSN